MNKKEIPLYLLLVRSVLLCQCTISMDYLTKKNFFIIIFLHLKSLRNNEKKKQAIRKNKLFYISSKRRHEKIYQSYPLYYTYYTIKFCDLIKND